MCRTGKTCVLKLYKNTVKKVARYCYSYTRSVYKRNRKATLSVGENLREEGH